MGKIVRKALKAIGYIKTVRTSPEDEALLETIRKNVQLDADATAVQRELELDDLRFCDPSTQWDDKDRRAREGAGRPCLTEDRLGPFLMQVTNEQRKNKPGCQVNPVDSGSDQETAEIIQGLIRHIEYSSNADTAYDTAFWWAAAVGRGFYRLCTDYVPGSFDEQEIQIKRVPNPHMVFIDPAAQEADFSDMKWGGFKAWMSMEDFKAQYPKAKLANVGLSEWRSIGDDAEDWMDKDGGACLVVEYYYKDEKPATLYKFSTENGETVGWEVPEGATELDKRETTRTYLKYVKCTAVEVLERAELPGDSIPIVAVLGKELIVDGKRTWAGLIRSGKDPQQRYNYLVTAEIERIAFMPLATWLGPDGFEGKDATLWNNAHKQQMAILHYKPTFDDSGNPAPPPQLLTPEAPIRAITEAKMGAEEGLKGVLGMYDPNMGRNESNQSGVAIQRLQNQGETGTYHLQDNLGRAIRYEGRIILSWLPTYYDTPRIARIIGEDGTQKQVKLNATNEEGDTSEKDYIGKIFDITTGRYDVTISSGPSYQSKRAEDRAVLMAMLQGPMGQVIAQRAGDLVAKTLDSPVAKELSQRLMPPDIAQKEQQGGQMTIPPQVQQQMQALSQQHEALVQALHASQDEIERLKAKNDVELQKARLDADVRLETNDRDNQTKILIAETQVMGAAALPKLKAKLAELEQAQEDIAQLAIQLHGAIAGPVSAPISPEPGEAPESPSPAIPAGAQPPNAGPSAGME